MNKKEYRMFSDGGSRGNPGPAAIGVVIYLPDGTTHQIKRYLGRATNNQAEYRALIAGLHALHQIGAVHVSCFLDSELLVKQLNREYKVKDQELGILFLEAWNLSSEFESISFTHVRREYNKKADSLVNQALDEHLKS